MHQSLKEFVADPKVVSKNRPAMKRRPFDALTGIKLLLEDKEDTAQVFRVMDALNGDFSVRDLYAFASTEAGAARIAEREELTDVFGGREYLRNLPSGSVGRVYLQNMEEQGISVEGLVNASSEYMDDEFDDLVGWFERRKRDIHDLFHVLTGYGTDPLGEMGLLAFSYAQDGGGLGVWFTAWVAKLQLKRKLPVRTRVSQCYAEGLNNGRVANDLLSENISELLREPLEDARRRLRIFPPKQYQSALQRIDTLDLDITELV